MPRILLIDDLRNPADLGLPDTVVVARTYEEGLHALKVGTWDAVYLDHDLGSMDPRETGYGLMCWLEGNRDRIPGRIEIITANAAGRVNMQLAMRSLYPDNSR